MACSDSKIRAGGEDAPELDHSLHAPKVDYTVSALQHFPIVHGIQVTRNFLLAHTAANAC